MMSLLKIHRHNFLNLKIYYRPLVQYIQEMTYSAIANNEILKSYLIILVVLTLSFFKYYPRVEARKCIN